MTHSQNILLRAGDIIHQGQQIFLSLQCEPYYVFAPQKILTFTEDRIFTYVAQKKHDIEVVEHYKQQKSKELCDFLHHVQSFFKACNTAELKKQHESEIKNMQHILYQITLFSIFLSYTEFAVDSLLTLGPTAKQETEKRRINDIFPLLARQYGKQALLSGEDKLIQLFNLIANMQNEVYSPCGSAIAVSDMLTAYNQANTTVQHEQISLISLHKNFTNVPCKIATMQEWAAYQSGRKCN